MFYNVNYNACIKCVSFLFFLTGQLMYHDAASNGRAGHPYLIKFLDVKNELLAKFRIVVYIRVFFSLSEP